MNTRKKSADWEKLTQRLEPRTGSEAVVLLSKSRQRALRDIVEDARRGQLVRVLFSGLDGGSKILAAQLLASELKRDLYRVDLSEIVSKYIGETEKNLRRLFDGAEACGAILFFDEADALFGRRTEVNDSHDRYARLETDCWLPRIKAYRGLLIFSAIQRDALDSTLLERIAFDVRFPRHSRQP